MSEFSNVALIPARAGSRRIPNKNIREFHGKPIISYPIQAAIETGIFSKVIVSTDSPEIAETVRALGAECLTLRPSELSGDEASTLSVVKYEINKYRDLSQEFRNLACIYAATPMLTSALIHKVANELQSAEAEFCFPVVKNHISSDRELILGSSGTVTPGERADLSKNTQHSENTFRDAGQFYWGSTESWLNYESIFDALCIGIEIPEYLGVDIDSEMNWQHAELIYAGLQQQKLSDKH